MYVFEAMVRCKLYAFELWLVENDKGVEHPTRFEESEKVNRLLENLCVENVVECMGL